MENLTTYVETAKKVIMNCGKIKTEWEIISGDFMSLQVGCITRAGEWDYDTFCGMNQSKRRIWKERKNDLEEDDFDAGFDVVRDEGITHVEGDVEQVVIVAAKVVNAGVSVSTAEPKTPPTTTTLLKDDEVTVAATLVQMITGDCLRRVAVHGQGVAEPFFLPQCVDYDPTAELRSSTLLAAGCAVIFTQSCLCLGPFLVPIPVCGLRPLLIVWA
ncbi:hypothetical protein Tco_1391402 [Tanacetum coccineum]